MKNAQRYALVDGAPVDTRGDATGAMSSAQLVSALNSIWNRLESARDLLSHSIDERLLAQSDVRYDCRETPSGVRWFAADGDGSNGLTNLHLHDLLTDEALRKRSAA